MKRVPSAVAIAIFVGYMVHVLSESFYPLGAAAPLGMIILWIAIVRWVETGDPPKSPDDPWREAADDRDET